MGKRIVKATKTGVPKEIIDIRNSTSKKLDTLNKKCLSGGVIDAYECVRVASKYK